jgi:chromatin remodeling complex protein RSC6
MYVYCIAPHIYLSPLENSFLSRLVAAEKNARITDEERRIRQDEADLFAKLAPPPVILDSLTYLMEQRKEGEREKEKEEREKEEEEQEKEADEEGTTAKPSRKRARLEG